MTTPFSAPVPGQGPAGTPPPPAQSGGATPKKPPTKKAVSRTRLIAIVLAVLAGLLILVALTRTESPSVYVLRATSDIAALTPVTAEQLEITPLTDDSMLVAGAISGSSRQEVQQLAESEVVGLYPRNFVPRGSQILATDLILNFADDPTLALAASERLISVSATPSQAVAGNLRPGDLVDIVGTVRGEDGDITEYLATSVPIIAVSLPAQNLDSLGNAQVGGSGETRPDAADLIPANPIPGTYVVKVDAPVVPNIVAASDTGALFLAYRTSSGASPQSADTAETAGNDSE